MKQKELIHKIRKEYSSKVVKLPQEASKMREQKNEVLLFFPIN